MHIYFNIAYQVYTAKRTQSYSSCTGQPIITYLADYGMFDEILTILKSASWNGLHNADRESLVMLLHSAYISSEFVSIMAAKGNRTANHIQTEMLTNPMFNVAHVSDQLKSDLLRESGAVNAISMLHGLIHLANNDELLSVSICNALRKTNAAALILTKFQLHHWIEHELLAEYAPDAMNIAENEVFNMIKSYIKNEINAVMFYQACVNASVAIPVFSQHPSLNDIPLATYFAMYCTVALKRPGADLNLFKRGLNAGFNSRDGDFNTIKDVSSRASTPLTHLPDYGF